MNANPYQDVSANRTHAAQPATVATQQPAQQPASSTAECGSGWYHDVAIQESQQAPARKH